MSEWQPVETVPRTPLKHGYGPTVLVFVSGGIGIGYWDEDFDRMYVEHPEHDQNATHWMPLPEPPK